MRRIVVGIASLVVIAAVAVGSYFVGRSERRSHSASVVTTAVTIQATTTSRTATDAQLEVALPVLSCPTSFGGDPIVTWQPQYEAITLPRSLKSRVAFYSNGLLTLLAPVGWTCSAGVGASGSRSLSVLPPDQAPAGSGLTRDLKGVSVAADYTGHGPGASLVCGYFPGSVAAKAGQPCDIAAGTRVTRLTGDVVSFTRGSTTGFVVYPQVADVTASVDVYLVTCDAGSLCREILSDARTRFEPSYSPPR